MIDVDKDNRISELDINTCIKNLTNGVFWTRRTADDKAKLCFNQDKATEVVTQIHLAMGKQKVSFRALFDYFDTDNDNMVSLAEF